MLKAGRLEVERESPFEWFPWQQGQVGGRGGQIKYTYRVQCAVEVKAGVFTVERKKNSLFSCVREWKPNSRQLGGWPASLLLSPGSLTWP